MEVTKIKKVFQAFHFEVKVQSTTLSLPIIFQKRYEYATLNIMEKSFLLIKEKRSGSLENFVKQAQAIEKQVNKDIILVFSQLSDTNKKKLMQIGVPYLDFQENAYIPQLGFLFSSSKNLPSLNQLLTSTEQRVLIALLLHSSSTVIDMEKISQVTNLAIPSLYRTFKVLKNRGWLTNKHQSYQFLKPKENIFQEAIPFLKNPVKEVTIISDDDYQKFRREVTFKTSYLKALSYLGMLSHTKQRGNYALSKKEYKTIEKELEKNVFEGHRIEIWVYEPIPFEYEQTVWSIWHQENNEMMVDPISLYLTLKDDDDPRIEEEIEILNQKIIDYLGGNNAS
ncbi:hypothetical protein TP70_07115 [Staphylococcus microti]|uniref:Transcriptional regulator n=1 Tax=Staphylococcus microti TaxID=569857 RepID=A0A0D6XPA5_9STAP|nr:hypothetical protein [Staphylococcus microti]KIX90457.1 hypothetical protein TP70_07115 [Staphylococcus microti]PNZ83361.1 hypothetical protein CD132_02340 [Staphylococcus microti]SUM57913.1 Uncharacterised protein [Staphylococcus microti]